MSKSVVMPFVRSAYNYDRDAVSQETGLSCPEPTLAQQSALEESDINTIVRRFGLTGQLPENVRAPQFADFSDAVTDYQTALNAVIAADAAFAQMPADVRTRFANDPAQFVAFCDDPKNYDEAVKLGLVFKKAPEPVPGPAGPPEAPPKKGASGDAG